MGGGGNEGDDDPKSSDEVDDAEVEGHAISSDPEPDADDWDFDTHNPPSTSTAKAPALARVSGDTEATGTGTSTPVTEAALKELEGVTDVNIDIDWALMNDEFDAWMEGDSSDEDEGEGGESKPKRAGGKGTGSKNMDVSEDEWTDETNSIIRCGMISILIPASLLIQSFPSSTPRSKRKRLRSLTPSEPNSAVFPPGDPSLRSPLSKRKKLSADRFGAGSKLKESRVIPALDLNASARSSRAGSLTPSENGTSAGSKPGTPRKDRKASSGEDDDDDDDDGSEEAFDIDDDFLAREMEELG
jgi:RNA polymerase II subunit A-like phosphatase